MGLQPGLRAGRERARPPSSKTCQGAPAGGVRKALLSSARQPRSIWGDRPADDNPADGRSARFRTRPWSIVLTLSTAGCYGLQGEAAPTIADLTPKHKVVQDSDLEPSPAGTWDCRQGATPTRRTRSVSVQAHRSGAAAKGTRFQNCASIGLFPLLRRLLLLREQPRASAGVTSSSSERSEEPEARRGQGATTSRSGSYGEEERRSPRRCIRLRSSSRSNLGPRSVLRPRGKPQRPPPHTR